MRQELRFDDILALMILQWTNFDVHNGILDDRKSRVIKFVLRAGSTFQSGSDQRLHLRSLAASFAEIRLKLQLI